MKYNEEKMKILRRAYIDYRQLERQLYIDFGNTNNLEEVYEYIENIIRYDKSSNNYIGTLNEDYFDFTYRNMDLSVSLGNRASLVRLCENIEIWDNTRSVMVADIDFNELEKMVLGYE